MRTVQQTLDDAERAGAVGSASWIAQSSTGQFVEVRADTGLFRSVPDASVLWSCATKAVVGLAGARLHDRGSLDLLAPVSPWLPEVTDVLVGVTAADLLSHAAPLAGSELLPTLMDEVALDELPTVVATTCRSDSAATASYSDWAPALALAAMVRASGAHDYDAVLRREVLAPLGLDSCRFHRGSFSGSVQCHRLLEGVRSPVTDPAVTPAPGSSSHAVLGLTGSLRDLLALYAALNEVGAFLSREAHGLLTTRRRVGVKDFGVVPTDWAVAFEMESRHYPDARYPAFSSTASLQAYGHKGMPGLISYADPAAGLRLVGFVDTVQPRDLYVPMVIGLADAATRELAELTQIQHNQPSGAPAWSMNDSAPTSAG